MLRVEANFIYQRKGYYEIILGKIAAKESQKSAPNGPKDELMARVVQQQQQ